MAQQRNSAGRFVAGPGKARDQTGSSIVVTGVAELQRTLARAGSRAPQMMAQALYLEAEFIMGKSKMDVPVMDGILRASGVVIPPKVTGTKIEVVFGYGGAASAYALAVHDNPRSGKTEGVNPSGSKRKKWAQVGEFKYLEKPANALFKTSAQRMAVTMRTLFQ